MQYRKKAVAVEAVRFTGAPAEDPPGVRRRPEDGAPYVVTIHDQRCYVEPGDVIITEPDGDHHYPVRPDIFAATYELASAESDPPAPAASEFELALRDLINRYSVENGSDTPDFILAGYLVSCLDNFEQTTLERERWWGRGPAEGDLSAEPEPAGP